MILAFLEKFFLYQKTEDMPHRPRIEKVNLLVDIYNYCISKYQNAHCINQALLLKKKKGKTHPIMSEHPSSSSSLFRLYLSFFLSTVTTKP